MEVPQEKLGADRATELAKGLVEFILAAVATQFS